MLIVDGLKFANLAGALARLLTADVGAADAGTTYQVRPFRPTRRSRRNPNDPRQAHLLELARAKRERKEDKRVRDTLASTLNNLAHAGSGPSLNPFYIAR